MGQAQQYKLGHQPISISQNMTFKDIKQIIYVNKKEQRA